MRTLRLLQIVKMLNLKQNVPDLQVNGYCVDSRNIQRGQLFFALKGAHLDGHDFIDAVHQKGACAAVVCDSYSQTHGDFTLIRVADPLQALQHLASSVLQMSNSRIVAITGSVGKTTIKEFVRTLLATSYSVAASPGNSNSQIGLPLSILNHTSGTEEIIILEMGMTESGQISKLTEIAPPEVGILSSVELVHACNFNTLEEIAYSKAEIFQHPKTKLGIINRDIPCYNEIVHATSSQKRSFSLTNSNADYTADPLNPFALLSNLDKQTLNIQAFKLPGKHNRHNLLAAIAVARYFNISWEKIEHQIAALQLPEMRLEEQIYNGVIFINDSYNASEISVKAALECLPEPKNGGKKIVVLGSMMELGKFSDECHRRIGEYALNLVDECYCFGKECQPIFDIWKREERPVSLYEDFSFLIEDLKKRVMPNDIVLVKGSRSKKMWSIIDAFKD